MTSPRTLAIAQPAAARLSPAQKRFNSVVKRIAEQRALLAQREEAVSLFREQDGAESDAMAREMARDLFGMDIAHANERLLGLLQLQLEAEQIDPGQLANLGAERLKHDNHVLAEQPDELRHQIAQLTLDTHHLRQQLPLLDDLPTLKRGLEEQRAAVRARQEEEDLLSLLGR